MRVRLFFILFVMLLVPKTVCPSNEPLYLIRGDTRPAYPIVLRSSSGLVDLSGTTITATVQNVITGENIIMDQPVLIIDPLIGLCEYRWASAQTNTVGTFSIQIKVLDAEGNTSTYPASYDARIIIRERY